MTGHQRSVLAWDLTLLPDGCLQLREHSELWLYETDAFVAVACVCGWSHRGTDWASQLVAAPPSAQVKVLDTEQGVVLLANGDGCSSAPGT